MLHVLSETVPIVGECAKNHNFFAREEKMTTFASGKVIHDQLPLNSPRA